MTHTRRAFTLALGSLILLAAGCGGSQPTGSLYQGEDHGVASTIEELNDAKGHPKKFPASFAAGSVPKEMKAFLPYEFYISGKPTISGTTATAKVSIRKQDGTEVGTPEWAFEKDGDKWKIKSAPLP